MLPRAHRVSRGEDFRAAVRRGRRTVMPHVVMYRLVTPAALVPRVGVIVSKQVGGAVVRNQVRRRVLAACAELLPSMRDPDLIVFRALPGSREATWDTLRAEIDQGLRRAVTTA